MCRHPNVKSLDTFIICTSEQFLLDWIGAIFGSGILFKILFLNEASMFWPLNTENLI